MLNLLGQTLPNILQLDMLNICRKIVSGMNGKLQFFRSVMRLRMFTVGLVGKF